jgi:hypothetical protein
MADTFSTDVSEFIGKYIHSIAQLEILLLLRSEPQRCWTADEVTQKLYLQLEMTTRLLSEIVHRGLAIRTDTGFRYEPAISADRNALDQLAEIYQERRVAVTAEIFSKPLDSLRAFSDAFRFRKEN